MTTPFDAATVGQRLSRQREVFNQRWELGQHLLLQRLTEMSAAERVEYAERLREVLSRRAASHQRRHQN